MRITVTLHRAVPHHLILQRIVIFNTSRVRTRSTTKKLKHCLENQKGYYLQKKQYTTAWKITNDFIYDIGYKMVMKVNANFAEHQRTIEKFPEHILHK